MSEYNAEKPAPVPFEEYRKIESAAYRLRRENEELRERAEKAAQELGIVSVGREFWKSEAEELQAALERCTRERDRARAAYRAMCAGTDWRPHEQASIDATLADEPDEATP